MTQTETAMFGAGCFWGVQLAFDRLEGVTQTEVGYAGGTVDSPTYEQVCTDTTGHAEVVRIEFDPSVLGYEKLLETFFASHDPTQVNRQGPDVGTQYRSVVFAVNESQKAKAEQVRQQLEASGKFPRPIVTSIEPAPEFHRAEGYHQKYLEKRGMASCSTGH